MNPVGAANHPVAVNVRTDVSVMELTMSRDQAIERVFLPLSQDYDGNANHFRSRLRFAVLDTTVDAGADVIGGFFSSEEFSVDDSTTGSVIEAPGSNNAPARFFGGAYDRRSLDLNFRTWYVYDLDFQPVPETAILRLFAGDGVTLIQQIAAGGTSGITRLNQIGFGNEDRSQSDATMQVMIDFMTWSVNASLPSDPAFAPDSLLQLAAGPRTWNVDAPGNWHSSANWNPEDVPSGPGDSAVFGPVITSPRTVYADQGVTIPAVQFNSPVSYAIAGTGVVELKAAAGNAAAQVAQGSHQFQAVVSLGSNADVHVAAGALAFNNRLRLNGHTLTKTGDGTMAINNVLEGDSGAVMVVAGVLAGSGKIEGSLTNAAGGVVAPGNSPGTLTVAGNYRQEDGATLAMEIGGVVAGVDYDMLVVTGEAKLDGSLWVELAGDFEPARGDAFQLLDFASTMGNFSEVHVPRLSPGLGWDSSALLTSGVLSVVPEPAASGLALVALGGLLVGRGRRAPRCEARSWRLRELIRHVLSCGAWLASILACNAALAVSGTIDFGSVPGFQVVDGGSPNVVVDVRTADSVMALTMTRDQAVERVALPIGTTFAGNANSFKARLRFGVTGVGGPPRADVLAGFFSSAEGTASGDSTTVAVIEPPGSNNSPARTFGGAYDRQSLDIELNKWYVYEFEFQPVPETAVLRLFEGNGTTLINEIVAGNTSGITSVDLIGFGNEDRSDDSTNVTAVIDFMTWSVNQSLPADPAYSSAALPLPLSPIRTWNFDAAGDWTNGVNWLPAEPPNDSQTTAVFGPRITAPRTVFTDVPVTVQRVEFDNQHTYAIAGNGSLAMQSAAGNASIVVAQGAHQIQANASLASNTTVDVAASARLEINNRLNLGSQTLTKTGAGTLAINNQQTSGAGNVLVNGGVLAGGGSIGGNLTNASGGTVAPGNSPGRLTIEGNYTQQTGSSLQIELGGTQAANAYDVLNVLGNMTIQGGALNVVLINGFAPQNGQSFDILNFASLTGSFSAVNLPAGFNWNTSQLLTSGVLSIGAGLSADFGKDGDVDGQDFLTWQANFGRASGASMGQGDANMDGDVDRDDFLAWQAQFGSSGSVASSVAAPEPASLALLLTSAMAAWFVAVPRRTA